MKKPILSNLENKIYNLAKPYLVAGENELHTLDTLNFAIKLLETKKGDRDVVVPAVILHDVGWGRLPLEVRSKARVPNPDISIVKDHEKKGVETSKEILATLPIESKTKAEILMIVGGHDTGKKALSLSDKIVKDADKLSRFSVNLWSSCKWNGMAPEDFCDFLETKIDKWFFLPVSRQLAKDELAKRRNEIEC